MNNVISVGKKSILHRYNARYKVAISFSALIAFILTIKARLIHFK